MAPWPTLRRSENLLAVNKLCPVAPSRERFWEWQARPVSGRVGTVNEKKLADLAGSLTANLYQFVTSRPLVVESS